MSAPRLPCLEILNFVPQADILLLILAVFLPPLVAFLKRGCGSQLLLNILLDFLGWVPGVIHAWYLVIATPESRH